jgi:uncharacterized protein
MISGAAGGLGKAFAVECASRGWNLFLTDLRAEALETLAICLRNTYGVSVVWQACDLSDAIARANLFDECRTRNLHFWALINVAGVDYEGLFCNCTRAQIRNIIRLNIEGTVEMTHALLALRNPNTTFRIINVASLAAFYPMPIKATYAASKRFLLDFSLALREEVRNLNASVTVLCPAGMPTNAECIKGIEVQGLAGQLTTQNIGSVAAKTLDYALRGRAVYIPGVMNRILQGLGAMLPVLWVTRLIGQRWMAVQRS